MNHTRLWVAAAIIALFIIIGFVLSVPHTRDVANAPVITTASSGVPSVTLRDTFKKGVHTITGSLLAPNACTTVSAQSTLQGSASSTESILVEVLMSDDIGVCLQLPTEVSFQTSLSAPARLPFTVMVNGSVATSSVL